MTLAATTLSDIILNADEDDIKRIYQTCKDRSKSLAAARASAVQVGELAEIINIKPKYLAGLTGKVVKSLMGRTGLFALELDEASTDRLRYSGGAKYYIPTETKNFVLDGLPATTLKVLSDA